MKRTITALALVAFGCLSLSFAFSQIKLDVSGQKLLERRQAAPALMAKLRDKGITDAERDELLLLVARQLFGEEAQ